MTDIFAKPLGILLKFIYDLFSNAGIDGAHMSAYALSIIVTTVIFKLILLPLTLNQTKSMENMKVIQPKLQEIQKKYKNDPQKVNEETMKLYKEYNVNPFKGCLPMLIQLPILFAYIRVVRDPVKYVFGSEKLFESINKGFLWVMDISKLPTAVINGQTNEPQIAGFVIPIMVILSAVTTFLFSKYSMGQQTSGAGANDQAQSTQKVMTYMMPAMFLFFGYTYPVGFTLYWTVSNIFSIVQQFAIKRFMQGKSADSDMIEATASEVKVNKTNTKKNKKNKK